PRRALASFPTRRSSDLATRTSLAAPNSAPAKPSMSCWTACSQACCDYPGGDCAPVRTGIPCAARRPPAAEPRCGVTGDSALPHGGFGWSRLHLSRLRHHTVQLPFLPQPSLPVVPTARWSALAGAAARAPAASALLSDHIHTPIGAAGGY